MMDSTFEQQVRERAYELWLHDRCIHGRADHHWFQAVRDILAGMENISADAPRAAQKRKRSPASVNASDEKPVRASRKRRSPEAALAG